MLKMLKFHLTRAQQRMKQQADRNRSDRSFKIGDKVLLKLQPYRQGSLKRSRLHKLSPRYYGPYTVLDKVGSVAYRLDLPPESSVHPTFHVSQLKPYHGSCTNLVASVPATSEDQELEPCAILDQKIVKRKNAADTMLLISWKNLSPMEATWEFASDLMLRFPDSPLWTRAFEEGENATGLHKMKTGSEDDQGKLGFGENKMERSEVCGSQKKKLRVEERYVLSEMGKRTDGAGSGGNEAGSGDGPSEWGWMKVGLKGEAANDGPEREFMEKN